MDGYPYAQTAEAKALHAVIDNDMEELRRVLWEMLPSELLELAHQARLLSRECFEMAAEK